MAAAGAVKQIYWLVGVSQEMFPALSAVEVTVFNTVVNSLNSLLFISSVTSASANGEVFPQTPLLVGSTLFVVGMLVETFSEWQRKQFKRDPKNKGKVYTGGLFGLARHVNYGGYTLWRTGFAIAAGGWIWGALTAGFFATNFLRSSIPELDLYCSERVSLYISLIYVSWIYDPATDELDSTPCNGRSTSTRLLTNCCRL